MRELSVGEIKSINGGTSYSGMLNSAHFIGGRYRIWHAAPYVYPNGTYLSVNYMSELSTSGASGR